MDLSFYVFLLALSWISNVVVGFSFAFPTTHHSKNKTPLLRSKMVIHYNIQSPTRKLTKLNLLFWGKGSDEKKKKEKEDTSKTSQNARQTSKMGKTATTMENFKQSQELGKKTGSLIQDLSSMQVEGVAARGKIKVYLDGQQQPTGVEIDDDYFKEGNAENFAEELLIAMQDAYQKSMQVQQDRMQNLYSELGLPPTNPK